MTRGQRASSVDQRITNKNVYNTGHNSTVTNCYVLKLVYPTIRDLSHISYSISSRTYFHVESSQKPGCTIFTQCND